MKINLSQPDITQREIDIVANVLSSNILSIGQYIEHFERKVAQLIGSNHAIAVNSGTSALHLIIKAFDIKDRDEVITTPLSFVASTNCILFERAKPVFVDIDPLTWEIDADKIEEKITPKTKAILAVDLFGHPLNMQKLRIIADKHNLVLIEDSCEALGSEYNGLKTGSLADAAAFAFYPNKQITTGEGGMVVTNNDKVAQICRSLRNQGSAKTEFQLYHDRLGYNYRMSEINAAIGSVQMDRLDEIIQKRSKVAALYDQKVKHIDGINLPYVSPNATVMSWFVYVIRLDEHIDRDKVMVYMKDKGIDTRVYFAPIHLQPYMREMFDYKEGDYPNAEKAGRICLALPFFNNLKTEEIDYVTATLKEAIAVCGN